MTAHSISFDPTRRGRARRVPGNCILVRGCGGGIADLFFVTLYVDDSIFVKVHFFRDDHRFLRASQSLISGHFRLLGERAGSAPPFFDERSLSEMGHTPRILGWVVDTEDLTTSHSDLKLEKLQRSMRDWPLERKSASERETAA